MPCTHTTLPNGVRAIVCSRTKPPTRCACRRKATRLCDWKVTGGTCDAPICSACTTNPAPEKDLCPAHAETWKAMGSPR